MNEDKNSYIKYETTRNNNIKYVKKKLHTFIWENRYKIEILI